MIRDVFCVRSVSNFSVSSSNDALGNVAEIEKVGLQFAEFGCSAGST